MSSRLTLPTIAASVLLLCGVAAKADPVFGARTATQACLAAVIDKAPVADIRGQDVSIHREAPPNLCAVEVARGDPAEVRQAAMSAIDSRAERFVPSRTPWAPGALASREAFCNAARRSRAIALMVDTARPGASPVLKLTVLETPARDTRCDVDLGPQRP